MDPSASVTLSPEDAQAIYTVFSHFNGLIDWAHVANDMAVTEGVARQRYSRALGALCAPAPAPASASSTAVHTPQAINHIVAFNTSNNDATTSASNLPASSSTPNSVATHAVINPPTSSTTFSGAAARQATMIHDLRPRVLPRMTGVHRACCFYGFHRCRYVDGCFFHTRCGYDVRVHFRRAHPGQVASFEFSRLVHRGVQEAEAWAEEIREDE